MDVVHRARVNLLDGFTVRLGARDVVAVGDELPHAVKRLIAHVSLSRRAARTAIAGSLWPEASEAHAQGSLRSALWRMQKALPGLVLSSGDSLVLADGVGVDVEELSSWARRALEARPDADEWSTSGGCLSGELLPGWYDDWVLLERERLRQLRMHALEAVSQRLLDAGRFGDALQAAYAAVRAEPLRESAHRILVRIHLAEGNVGEALRAFEQFRELLADELGEQPSPRMNELLAGLGGHPGRRSHRPGRARIGSRPCR
jgi:DNA-binding SARP family transcriptional activator